MANEIREQYQSRRAYERGASLLDLLIVVVIIGIILCVAIPQMGRSLELRRLDVASAKVASKLSEARSVAIKRNSLGKLNITAGQNTMQVATPLTTVGPVETLPGGITFSSSTPANITFDSLGRLNTSAQTVTLQSTSGKTKTVSISARGEVTIGSMS